LSCLQNASAEGFLALHCIQLPVLFPGLPSDANAVTPNTEYSWDFTTKTRSTNDDGTSLDLEWEDEEGERFLFCFKLPLTKRLVFVLTVTKTETLSGVHKTLKNPCNILSKLFKAVHSLLWIQVLTYSAALIH